MYNIREWSGAGHELYKNADHLSWRSDLQLSVADLRQANGLEDGEVED